MRNEYSTYYCVLTIYDSYENVSSKIVATCLQRTKPQDSFENYDFYELHTNWFKHKDVALDFIQECLEEATNFDDALEKGEFDNE